MIRLRGLMEEHGLDAFIVTRSLRYFAGTTAGKMLIIPLDGEPVLITSRLERDQALQESWVKDVRGYSGWKSPLRPGERVYFMKPVELLAEYLRELGSKTVGYESMGSQVARRLKHLYGVALLELPKLVFRLREIKDPEEIQLLDRSARIAAAGMRAARETIREGVKEIEVAAQAEYAMRRAGGEGTSFPTIVASGPHSWHPHSSASERVIRRGELVVVDLGSFYRGYASDCTRTFGVRASKKQLRVVEIVKRAQRAAIERIRDGVSAGKVCLASNRVLERTGLLRYSLHGLGHGVGIEIHESPSLYPGSEHALRENMVVTVEPGVYIPKLGGARWEDMVLVKRACGEPITLKYLR